MIFAGEYAFADRAPRENRDAFALAIRDDLRLDIPLQHVVSDLIGDD